MRSIFAFFVLVLSGMSVGADLPQAALPVGQHVLTEPRIVEKLAQKEKEKSFDAIWLGDSITHFWEACWESEARTFKEKFPQYKILNFGFGGDRTQETLFLLEKSGILDDVKTSIVNLLIGTNNLWKDTPEDTALGVRTCVETVRRKLPDATIVLISILPREVAHVRGGKDYTKDRPEGVRDHILEKIVRTNGIIRKLADGKHVIWVDLYPKFLDADELPRLDYFHDGTHPNAAGYKVIADAILPVYKRVLKK